MNKTKHWYQINKDAFLDAWDCLSNIERKIIIDDEEHKSWSYRNFINKVKADTEGRYNSPEYYLNEKYSFKYPYHTDPYQTN